MCALETREAVLETELAAAEIVVGAPDTAFDTCEGATLRASLGACLAVEARDATVDAFADGTGLDLTDDTLDTLLGRLP